MKLQPKGSALVLAMMIVAITSVIAYALIETSTFAVRRTTQLNNMDMCKQAAHASELYAKELLTQAKNEIPALTELTQPWAQPFEMQLEQGIRLKAQISDLQGKFNINLLRSQGQEGIYTPELIFSRLLVLLNIGTAQTLQQSLTDWLGDPDSESDQVYLERKPAYQPAHNALASISELGLIQGYTAPIRTLLDPLVSTLPEDKNININTAPAEVLAALLNSTLSVGLNLVEERLSLPFNSTQEFTQRVSAKGIAITDQPSLLNMITINSQYFLLKTTATCNKTTLISYSFIERSPEKEPFVYRRTQQL